VCVCSPLQATYALLAFRMKAEAAHLVPPCTCVCQQVYMDALNRRIATELLFAFAAQSDFRSRQFILLTPQVTVYGVTLTHTHKSRTGTVPTLCHHCGHLCVCVCMCVPHRTSVWWGRPRSTCKSMTRDWDPCQNASSECTGWCTRTGSPRRPLRLCERHSSLFVPLYMYHTS
jgi:hypothetical protein